MPEIWYRWLYRFVDALYFARITLIHPERLPRGGPVLYLTLHRNGAVDGFIYHRILGEPTFLISTQLRRSWFGRLFFDGIAVSRAKDKGNREGNDDALRECLRRLQAGGKLAIFPEGTSSLGPRHLPFKSGAAWLILDYLAAGGPPLQVVPVGIHYECPWSFRSKVEVVLGESVSTELPGEWTRHARLREIKRRVQTALEAVGVNIASPEYQETIQRLAYGATLATPRSYFQSLKALEQSIPERILSEAAGLEHELQNRRLLFHQGVPLFPMGPVALYLAALLLLAPVVVAAIALNLLPYLAGWFAGRKFPDGPNVISLWKILVGVPLFVLWAVLVAGALVLSRQWLPLGGYILVTWLGVWLYYRVKKLGVAVHNAVRCPELRPRLLAFRESVLATLPDETSPPAVTSAENAFQS